MHENLKLCHAKGADTEKSCKFTRPPEPPRKGMCVKQESRRQVAMGMNQRTVVRHATQIKTKHLFSKTKHLCKFHPALLEGCLVSWRVEGKKRSQIKT